MLDKFFKKKKLYFAVVISDRPADGFEFTPDKDCKIFLFNGEVDSKVVIPNTTLKAALDKFIDAPVVESKKVLITEKKA